MKRTFTLSIDSKVLTDIRRTLEIDFGFEGSDEELVEFCFNPIDGRGDCLLEMGDVEIKEVSNEHS